MAGFAQALRDGGLAENRDLASWQDGCVDFLGQSIQAAPYPPWFEDRRPMLWRYKLHGFEFAHAAICNGQAGDGERLHTWVRHWIETNPPGTPVAWDAYPISERLLHWALALSFFGWNGPTINASMVGQAHYLAARLERDVRANHLLKNAAALCVVGALFGEAPAPRALKLLESQVREQILPDGGHYERSPMYHTHVLMDCACVYAALETKPPWLREAMRAMTAFLEGIRHPDGDIPLFNDAALDGTHAPGPLLGAVHNLLGTTPAKNPPRAYPQTGFYRLGPQGTSGSDMLVKAHPPEPAYQPGHIHGGLGAFELSAGGRRMVVDSGTHGYAESPLRAYCRSAAAHNIARVSGKEFLECWSTFRVGRRYRCTVRHEANWMRIEHDAFLPTRHTRCIRYEEALQSWLVADVFDSPAPAELESFVHFHPDAATQREESRLVALRGGMRLWLHPFGVPEHAVVRGAEAPPQGWYCPRFGQAEPAPVWVLRARGAGRTCLGYAIQAGETCLPRESLESAWHALCQGNPP